MAGAIGRQMTPQEQQMAAQMLGWKGGPITGAQMNQLLVAAKQYMAGQPGATPAPAPAQTSEAYWEQQLRSKIGQTPQLPTTELPTYSPMELQQGGALGDIINQILQNPLSMSAQNVNQLKEINKEQELDIMRQLQDQAGQGAAGRGTYGGGNFQGAQRDIADRATGNITRGNREVDLRKMVQDQEDRFRAAEFGRTGRQLQSDENYRGYETQANQVNFALQRALSQAGLDQNSIDQMLRAWQVATQSQLGRDGMTLDKDRLAEQRRQFDKGHNLDWVRTMNDMVMGRAGHGLDLARMQQGAQNDMFSWLFR